MPEAVAVSCPYCGEAIELDVDTSVGPAAYVEDCPVCCQPMEVEVTLGGAGPFVQVRTGDE